MWLVKTTELKYDIWATGPSKDQAAENLIKYALEAFTEARLGPTGETLIIPGFSDPVIVHGDLESSIKFVDLNDQMGYWE